MEEAEPAAGKSSYTGISCSGTSQIGCSPWGGYLAEYMLGDASGYMQGAGEIADVTGWQVGPFVQDDWKIRPNLTINLGLRWDPNTPPVSKNGRGSAWAPGANTVAGFANSAPGKQSTVYTNSPAGLLFPGDPGVPNTLMNSDYGYWEPRIGLAYQPKVLSHTVFHTGFGIFTGPLQYSEYNHAADVAPFSPTFNFSGWCWPCSADTALGGAIIPFDNPWSGQRRRLPLYDKSVPGNIPLGDDSATSRRKTLPFPRASPSASHSRATSSCPQPMPGTPRSSISVTRRRAFAWRMWAMKPITCRCSST